MMCLVWKSSRLFVHRLGLANRLGTALALWLFSGAVVAEDTGEVLFEDQFASATLSPEWQIREGRWAVEDGALVNRGGGLITLDLMPGTTFAMEGEIKFPSNWTSVILFYTGPEDYGTLYFGGGYWESFEMEGEEIGNYIQHKDPDIVPGMTHRIRVVCDGARVDLYYDDTLKGASQFQPRPGSRIAFRNQAGGGLLAIRNIRITRPPVEEGRTICSLSAGDLSGSTVYRDYQRQGTLSTTNRVIVHESTQAAELRYSFADGDVFESCFARIPLKATPCRSLRLDVHADGSGNTLFIVLHDQTGEQHLVVKAPMEWQGWQDVGVNLGAFLAGPLNRERSAIHWKGDGNQKIDFAITAMDIGIAKRGTRRTGGGAVRFKNVRFAE